MFSGDYIKSFIEDVYEAAFNSVIKDLKSDLAKTMRNLPNFSVLTENLQTSSLFFNYGEVF